MTREHVVPHGSIPLLPRPHGTPPPPRPRRPEGLSVSLGAPPPGREPLPGALRPELTELSGDAVAFGRTAAYPWGVVPYPRGTRVTRTRLRVAADRPLLRGVRLTTPARTALDVAHGASVREVGA